VTYQPLGIDARIDSLAPPIGRTAIQTVLASGYLKEKLDAITVSQLAEAPAFSGTASNEFRLVPRRPVRPEASRITFGRTAIGCTLKMFLVVQLRSFRCLS
jgi:hypothetical protein